MGGIQPFGRLEMYVTYEDRRYGDNEELREAISSHLQPDQRFSMIAGEGLPESDTCYVFDSDSSLEDFVGQFEIGDQIKSINEKVAKAQAEESNVSIHKFAEQRHAAIADRIHKEYTDLAARTQLDIGSLELLKRASIDSPEIEPAVFDPTVAWEDVDQGGAFVPLAATIPHLGWIQWNNKISSVLPLGAIMFCDLPWYRGSKLFLAGPDVNKGYWNLTDFHTPHGVSWNDLPSSFIAL